MPSPIGHALGSLIVGGSSGLSRADVVRGILLVAIGVAPDLDLLWGRHHLESHSVGAALVVGFVLACAPGVRRILGVRTVFGAFVLVSAVWFAHPLMDALGADDSPPRGVMLFWPFSHEILIAPVAVFDAISRMWWRDDVWTHNVRAAAREVIILGPITLLMFYLRRKNTGSGRFYQR